MANFLHHIIFYLSLFISFNRIESITMLTAVHGFTIKTAYSSGTSLNFTSAVALCGNIKCRAFSCSNPQNKSSESCSVLGTQWTNMDIATIECTGCELYREPRKCDANACLQNETCYGLVNGIRMVNNEEVGYKCCPKFTCGYNCEMENYMFYKDSFRSINPYNKFGPDYFQVSVDFCLSICSQADKCSGVNFVTNNAMNRTECWLYDVNALSRPIAVSPTTTRVNDYYYRSRKCESQNDYTFLNVPRQ